jgi:hypothetical protein
VESDGFVWVVPSLERPVSPVPPPLRHASSPDYVTVRRSTTLTATLHAALENTLDVPHTSFLHRGLFRGRREPVPVQVTVRHGDGMVEAVFEGEPRPPGIAARVLAPEGGVVEHTDRFRLPSIAEVEYRLGTNHLLITSAYTPVSDFETVLHAAVSFNIRMPAAVARALVTPIANVILRQDAAILRQQVDNVRRFGGERYVSTPIDVLGPHILRLLRRAERGETPDDADPTPHEERVVLYT